MLRLAEATRSIEVARPNGTNVDNGVWILVRQSSVREFEDLRCQRVAKEQPAR